VHRQCSRSEEPTPNLLNAEAHQMASRDRPHREEKKKPKDASQKGINKIQPLLEPPTNVEVWKPKRKPRTEKETES